MENLRRLDRGSGSLEVQFFFILADLKTYQKFQSTYRYKLNMARDRVACFLIKFSGE